MRGRRGVSIEGKNLNETERRRGNGQEKVDFLGCERDFFREKKGFIWFGGKKKRFFG